MHTYIHTYIYILTVKEKKSQLVDDLSTRSHSVTHTFTQAILLFSFSPLVVPFVPLVY